MGQAATSYKGRPSPRPVCLLIEDSDFDLKRFERILEASIPMQIYVATTLEEAQKVLAEMPINLIILDNMLPDGLGVDFANRLRQTARWSKVPIIMVSDHPTPFLYDKAVSAKISMVLTKDKFQPRHVRDALRMKRFERLMPNKSPLPKTKVAGEMPSAPSKP